jgi:hypothetical protein
MVIPGAGSIPEDCLEWPQVKWCMNDMSTVPLQESSIFIYWDCNQVCSQEMRLDRYTRRRSMQLLQFIQSGGRKTSKNHVLKKSCTSCVQCEILLSQNKSLRSPAHNIVMRLNKCPKLAQGCSIREMGFTRLWGWVDEITMWGIAPSSIFANTRASHGRGPLRLVGKWDMRASVNTVLCKTRFVFWYLVFFLSFTLKLRFKIIIS